MDLSSLKKPEKVKKIVSENLLLEEKETKKVSKKSKKKVGRPTSKTAGVVYKKVWYDLPEDLLQEIKTFQVINKFETGSLLIEAALEFYMKKKSK